MPNDLDKLLNMNEGRIKLTQRKGFLGRGKFLKGAGDYLFIYFLFLKLILFIY